MSADKKACVLAIDPGLHKFGLAVLDADGEVIEKSVVTMGDFAQGVLGLIDRHHPDLLAMGGGTGSGWIAGALSAASVKEIHQVDERNTTLEARELAWKENPPGGLWRLLPKIFWPTPGELDAWAAVVIGRRALKETRAE